DRGEVWLYKGLGDGRFTLLRRVLAGNAPSGLAVDDVNNDGKPDLMVGNEFGDILFILGNGDGTFRPFVRTDHPVPFVVTDPTAASVRDAALRPPRPPPAPPPTARPAPGDSTPGAFQPDRSTGLIGPADVAQADLDARYATVLVFAIPAINNVVVYLRQPDGS